MKSGTRKTKQSHRDYDFLLSHRFGSLTPTEADIPDQYFADAGLTVPDQETEDFDFYPPVPPMPFGCTNEAQADVTTDLTKTKHSPSDLEAVTHANTLGGYDIRKSMDTARSLGWFKSYFNVTNSGITDHFDAFRIAQVMGVAANENRAISFGTPWFSSWEQAALKGQYIMPMPTDDELKNVNTMPWHNSVLDGWHSVNGVLVYRDKSWQGNQIGQGGFIAFPREVINTVMGISGTVAFIPTLVAVQSPITVSLSVIPLILSVLRSIFGL